MATTVIVPTEGGTNPCLISKWAVKEGDKVSLGDMLCEAETDKSVLDILATTDGTILKIVYGNDEMAPVLTPIAIIGEPGEDISSLIPEKKPANVPEEKAPERVEAAPIVAQPDVSEKTSVSLPVENSLPSAIKTLSGKPERHNNSSPRAKRYAREHGISLEGIEGTGYNGAVIERNVMDAYAAFVATGGVSTAQYSDDYTVYNQTRIEKTSAERLMGSLQGTAQSTMTAQANAAKMVSLRKRIKALDTAVGIAPVTFNDMVLYATAKVLAEHPEINCVWAGEELHRYNHVHLGVAVDTERGLVVPVIRNADTMSLSELSVAARELVEKARQGKLTPAEMNGGTFTVSNIGAMGIKVFTPIVNPPQVCILGVGAIEPWFEINDDGDVTSTEIINLSLTHDHRAVDGAPAARFLRDVCSFIKNFDIMLAK